MAVLGYHPEMGEKRPDVTVEASLAHYGRHYFVRSKAELPGGRGVEPLGQLTADRLVPGSSYVGWYEYKMTIRAFDALTAREGVAVQMLL